MYRLVRSSCACVKTRRIALGREQGPAGAKGSRFDQSERRSLVTSALLIGLDVTVRHGPLSNIATRTAEWYDLIQIKRTGLGLSSARGSRFNQSEGSSSSVSTNQSECLMTNYSEGARDSSNQSRPPRMQHASPLTV